MPEVQTFPYTLQQFFLPEVELVCENGNVWRTEQACTVFAKVDYNAQYSGAKHG